VFLSRFALLKQARFCPPALRLDFLEHLPVVGHRRPTASVAIGGSHVERLCSLHPSARDEPSPRDALSRLTMLTIHRLPSHAVRDQTGGVRLYCNEEISPVDDYGRPQLFSYQFEVH
jgi:hypothetical protein